MAAGSNPSSNPIRDAFDEDGFCVVPNLLDAGTVGSARLAVERLIRPDTPEEVAHIWGTRRQTKTPAVFLPELDEIAHRPRMLETVAKMIDGPFRVMGTPIAIVTFTGKVCGDIQTYNWIGHLDGVPTESFEKIARTRASLWIALADIETMGGAMVVVRGSHRHIHRLAANDPAWVEYRRRDNMYLRYNNIEGIPWHAAEVTCKAGDGFFYHGHSIHSASDNHRPQPRIVALFNYVSTALSPATEATLSREFSQRHLESMSPMMRKAVGL